MIKLLALDAATEVCSVAIDTGDQRWSRFSDIPKSHAQKLLPYIDELINESQQPLKSLDAIALTHGPGSFTGIRIAMSVAQGLSYSCGLPLIPVSSLDALAHTFCFTQEHSVCKNGDYLITALDARMSETYWAAYQLVDGSLKVLQGPSKSAIDEFQGQWRLLLAAQPEFLDGATIFAIGHGWAIPLLAEQATTEGFTVHANVFPSAEGVVDYVRAQASPKFDIIAQLSCDAGSIEPLYLRNEITWKKRERIRSTDEI